MVAPSMVVMVGTDTGVGKTWTGCALARLLVRRGHRVVAIKPLETGCSGPPAENEDGVALARATGQSAPRHALLRFRDPVAPPEAAEREGTSIDFEALISQTREFAAHAQVALVEGAGGLLSPLTWERNAVDLARALDARVLLLAADRLGTINHTLMALQVLALHQVEVVGVVLGTPKDPDASTGSNASAIVRLSTCRRVVCVPWASEPQKIPSALNTVVDWLHRASS